MRCAADGDIETDGEHELLEGFAVFALVNGLGVGADHLDSEPLQNAVSVECHRRVQSSLTAERGEQDESIGDLRFTIYDLRTWHVHGNAQFPHFVQLADYDLLHGFGRDWLDVRAIGELRVGHDGGRIRVHQNDTVTLLLKGFAGLRAGIVELARLADDDRSGADDEDGMNVGSSGHLAEFMIDDLRFTSCHNDARQVVVQTATDETRMERGTKGKLRRGHESQTSH